MNATAEVLSADIVIESVEPKEGVSAKTGKPWKLFRVNSTAGAAFSTFDGTMGSAAFGAVGRRAHITYKTGERGNDLVTLTVDDSSEPTVEPVRAQTPAGNPDWDMIGLHKTRCALWAAILPAVIPLGTGDTIAVARELVIAAEVDIFHRQPAEETSDIPFDGSDSFDVDPNNVHARL